MNRTRRSAAALAVATSVALTASACSSSSSPPESAATASTAVKPASSVTLEDYYTADPQKAAMEGVYSACADKLGITISSTHVANVALIPKVLQQISSKTLPDVLMIPGVSAQQIAQSGALAPLTDYGIDGSGRPKGIVDVGTYKGTLYGLAPVVNATALFYNVDTLKAAGIQAPKTWDELAAAAAQLTKGDEYGFAFSASADEGGTSQFLPFMWSNGGELTDITSSETAQALQFLTDLVNAGSASKSVVTWNQADVASQFIAGKASMMVNGPWQIPTLNKNPDLHWATVQIPTRLASQKSSVPLGGEVFSVTQSGNAAQMTGAGEVVKCITDEDSQLVLGEKQINLPASTTVAAKIAQEQPDLASFIAALPDARSRTAELGPDYPKVSTQLQTALQLAITGKASPQDALDQAAKQ